MTAIRPPHKAEDDGPVGSEGAVDPVSEEGTPMGDESSDPDSDADEDEDGSIELLDPYASPPGQEDEPDPDIFAQENDFYWSERSRREAGLPPTELFRIEMTTEFVVTDLKALAEWIVEHVDEARDLQLNEGGGENGGGVLVASYDGNTYALDDAWDMLSAALRVLESWSPLGTEIQSSAWDLAVVEERDITNKPDPSAFEVTMKCNIGVDDISAFSSWLLQQVEGRADLRVVDADNHRQVEVTGAEHVYQLNEPWDALQLSTERILPELSPPGVEVRNGIWDLVPVDEDTPPPWA